MIGADTRLPIDPAANPVWPLARWMATNLRKFAGHIASDAVNGIPCSPLHSAYWSPTFRAPMLSNRIVRCAVFLLLFSLLTAQSPAPDHELRHRGFVMNMSAVEHQSNIVALTAAMRHQLDIAADSGAKPEILAFFRNQKIAVLPTTGHGGGLYARARGVELDGVVPPHNNPVVLHEFMHAMHNRYLPQSSDNPDIVQFYQRAVTNQLYSKGEYLLTNKGEFFAVTASLYLWGSVAREPHNRETLRAKQPNYYKWLGDIFGVRK